MKITVDGGSFKISVDTEYDNLITEATSIFNTTLNQAKSSDKTILRFLQIIIENKENNDAIGYAILGLLGWYHLTIHSVEHKDIELNLPKIIPHIINPTGDFTATSQQGEQTFKH